MNRAYTPSALVEAATVVVSAGRFIARHIEPLTLRNEPLPG